MSCPLEKSKTAILSSSIGRFAGLCSISRSVTPGQRRDQEQSRADGLIAMLNLFTYPVGCVGQPNEAAFAYCDVGQAPASAIVNATHNTRWVVKGREQNQFNSKPSKILRALMQ